MLRAAILPRTSRPAQFALGLGGSVLLAALVARGGTPLAFMAAAVPAVLIAFGALVASDRSILVFGALALSITAGPLNNPLPLPGGVSIFTADLVVVLALAAWLAAWLTGDRSSSELRWHRTPILAWPLLLFAVAMIWAAVRGHELYGTSLVGQPVRLVLYAGIAAAIAGMTARKAYAGIVAVFYVGTVWMLLNAAYFIATGTSQTEAQRLSTGGARVLSLSVAMYMAAALFLALLNLQIDDSARRRALHITIAALAASGTLLAFGRSTFAALAVVLPLLLFFFRRVSGPFFGLLPLCLPFVVLGAILIPRVEPDLATTLADRLRGSPSTDLTVRWREEANAAVWEQVRESPLIGVGFGRETDFILNGTRWEIGQDPHNSFMWLLAGGGVFALGSFALILVAFTADAWRRLRRVTDPHARLIIAWSALALFMFLVNAGAGPVLSGEPSIMLTVWVLLLLPSIVTSTPSPTRPLNQFKTRAGT
jgi:O-antigen ligase